MAKKKATRKKASKNIEEECMRIALSQVGNVEEWLKMTARKNPALAIKMWKEITKFAVAEKSRDQNPGARSLQQINITMIPATKSQEIIEIEQKAKALNEYTEDTPYEEG